MLDIITWLFNNSDWIFSGIGVTLVAWILSEYFKTKGENADAINNKQGITNNVTVSVNTEQHQSKNKGRDDKDQIDVKAITHILFMDDEDFPIVKRLKDAGWINTKLKKKISNLDDPAIADAQIIFVDIQGVCKDLFKDEGLGLAGALKDKYGDKKKVVLYSDNTEGDRFNPNLKKVDESLPKNAEVYEFIRLVDQFAVDIWKED